MTSPIAEQAREGEMNNSSKGRIEPSHSTDSVSQDINSDADLLPCPMRHAAEWWHPEIVEPPGNFYIRCGCGISTHLFGDRESLVTFWNTRACTPAVAQQARDYKTDVLRLLEDVEQATGGEHLPTYLSGELFIRITAFAAAEYQRGIEDAARIVEQPFQSTAHSKEEGQRIQLVNQLAREIRALAPAAKRTRALLDPPA